MGTVTKVVVTVSPVAVAVTVTGPVVFSGSEVIVIVAEVPGAVTVTCSVSGPPNFLDKMPGTTSFIAPMAVTATSSQSSP